ncbi:MAG: ornithine carbamoyltransferase [Nitratireductor sp.]
MTETPRHFKDISQFDLKTLNSILSHADDLKKRLKAGEVPEQPLRGKVLAMIFEKPSTRTRVSFDVGMRQLGGETIVLSGSDMQLGHSESIADTARVLSRFVDAIMIRTSEHSRMEELAHYSSIPVINALTDDTHPCQIMADLMTFQEHNGSLEGKKFAWTGDGNNVLHSFLEASAKFGFSVHVAHPRGCAPQQSYVDWANQNGANIIIGNDPISAVKDADAVITDCWVSMGQDDKADASNIFEPFQVNSGLMAHAKKDAIFMHCLPAHRGEEVTDEVMDGPQSVVFDEAENRLHAQKGVLAWCFGLI